MFSHFMPPVFLGKRLHLGMSGSIAAYKLLDTLRAWRRCDVAVTVTLTQAATRFVTPLSLQALGAGAVFTSLFDDPAAPDDFGHLHPLHHAHAMVVAPASATTLARLAHGLADEILSCQALAFQGPLVLAPAMNPAMWSAPATQANWQLLKDRGHICIEPDDGGTACGDDGRGRLCRVEHVFLHGLKALAPQDLAGVTVLVTLGPTREFFDPARFWSNPSTGLMGASLVTAAWLRGATVHAVCGPGVPDLPPGVQRHDVVSAVEMHAAAMALFEQAQLTICSAAVADFAPEPYGASKFKKDASDEPFTVSFVRNPDILATMGQEKALGQLLVGFAAETDNLELHAQAKLARKNADMLVANRIGAPGSGFASATNAVYVVDRQGRAEQWPGLPKPEVAWRLLDWLLPELQRSA
ncbi:bifunctional phosphopantothenoylcysteine decarboxylase/phosphopantothenate--cysteine ligase CoaBC [Megalodesulfovibrio gigas]|uniref:Coenzyme A biosynthesis bifunctional protein CoaBC n=1 Tax=Megalodesulfovibrio gigas (strain ATCC 19364 / DSM 1382 / NCIMB 9332 / VKM B-1759) TaxID=1121448 RepID=T2G9A7_MEGG1|nr:bifunctional phosphopantothenoylcysteine decarboxylase/phosphopantothenate--cysteine ligase CoaBC [Megalodesulfovibrio gigas]AGW12759.1 putative phosphopantothenoylcysteine decarboxylase/phosphopantothenate/cysteine ligase [Megalodesulfovibrio gigas DSM 1382 = ATCC 19364]